MKITHSTQPTTIPALSTATAAKKNAATAFETNSKEFGPVAASVIGLSDSASQATGAVGKVVNSIENGAKELANNTVSLAHDGVQELKTAYNTVSNGMGTAASAVGSAASAVAGYTQTGIAAGVQAINALV